MKAAKSRLHVFVIALFILGALFSAYQLINLSDDLERSSTKIDLTVIQSIQPVLLHTYLTIGITLLLGILALILMYLKIQNQEVKEKLVYVEKEKKKGDGKTGENNTLSKDIQALVDEIEKQAGNVKDSASRITKLLALFCARIEAGKGAIFQLRKERNKRIMALTGGYALSLAESENLEYEFGEGLVGQAAKDGKTLHIDEIPDGYIKVVSGLGTASPTHLLIVPLIKKGEVVAVAELAAFKEFTNWDEQLILQLLELTAKDLSSAKSPAPKKKEIKKTVDKK